jgi:D-3-phosphoglycerate dehydrogenase
MHHKTVLLNRVIHPDALQRLRAEARTVEAYAAPRDELLAQLAEAHALVLGTGFAVGGPELDQAAKLEVIGRHGVGLDNIDVLAAHKRGIPVTYTPQGPTESTAEHALLLILGAARRVAQLDRAVRSGAFGLRNDPAAMGRELQGLALGVVGFGRIGRRVAQMARGALQMTVYVCDPYLTPTAVDGWGAIWVADPAELAAQVDVLTIHTPLTSETHHLIDGRVLAAIKSGAILVNTSRGPVVDEAALIEALQSGRLAGAGLDVYDPQPPAPDNPLLQMEQVVLTPHVGSFTQEGRRRMGLTVVEDVLRALRGERPRYLVNPEVWARRRRSTP